MGRFQEDTRLARLQPFLQRAEATCPMRVEQVMIAFPYLFHGFGYLSVRISGAAYLGGDSCVTTPVKIKHTSKVTRIAHIHGVGNCGNAGTRRINTRLQILVENIVTVIGRYETLHW